MHYRSGEYGGCRRVGDALQGWCDRGAELRRTTPASSSFNDVEPGTYEFSATITSNGITYDVFTNKVGGYDLTGAPTLEVGEDAGTYSINLALKTSNPPQCDL